MHSPASLMTGAFACRTMPPSASYGPSPWEEEIGPSPAPMRAAGAPRPSTPSLPAPNSTIAIRRLGSPTCWPACRITPPSAFTNSCLGTGALRTSLALLERNSHPQKRPNQGSPPDAYVRSQYQPLQLDCESH